MLKKLALLIFGILIGLVCAEIGLRAWDAWTESDNVISEGTHNLAPFHRYDSLLGWTPLPGAESRDRVAEFDVTYRVNGQGVRNDTEIEKEKTLPRVAVAGDSFTFGIGVPIEKTYTKRLADILGYEGINLGVGGYDPGQYFLRMRRDGIPFDPDVVVYGIYLGNDIQEIDQDHPYQSNQLKPRFSIEEGELVLHNVPIPIDSGSGASLEADYRIKNKFIAKVAGIASKFELFSLVKNVLKNYLYRELAWLGIVKDIDEFSGKFELLEAVLRESKRETEGRLFVVAIIPSVNVKHNYLEQKFAEKLSGILEELLIPYANLVPYVLETEGLYFKGDRHFNPDGHELAAQKLAELIKSLQKDDFGKE